MKNFLIGVLLTVLVYLVYINYVDKRVEVVPPVVYPTSSVQQSVPTQFVAPVPVQAAPIIASPVPTPTVIPTPLPTEKSEYVVTCKETKVYAVPVLLDELSFWTMPDKFAFVIERYSEDFQWAKVLYPGATSEWWVLTESFTYCP